jgi:DNA-binding phage protein
MSTEKWVTLINQVDLAAKAKKIKRSDIARQLEMDSANLQRFFNAKTKTTLATFIKVLDALDLEIQIKEKENI